MFLLTPATKLSDIYSTLGCAHSLQQSLDDSFVPPSIPVLNSRGFETWQTIQLLLDPEEHVHYLQNAVKQFPLRDPETGELFPREIPADAFPRHPDRVTEKWHEEAFAIKNAEKKRREVEEQADLNSAAPTIVESEEEDWSYRPRRKHRHHHATYDDSEPYSRSAPGSGHEQPGRSSRGHSNKSHRQHHSYSHPTYTPEMVLETPVPSDTDDDLYRGHYTRATESHSRTRRSKHSSSQSNSRTRGTSRDYIGSYVYANGETAPIDGYQVDTYAQMTSEPAATYVRPSESHLHTYHSVPDIHYEPPTPQMSFVSSTPAEDDLRSRFLRHRSSSPATRAPLGPTPTATRSGSRGRVPYVEQGYEPPQEIYYDAEELVVEAERELERRRKKEARRVEKEAGRRKEHAYIQAHGRATGEGWGGAGYNGGRKSAGVSSYYPS